MPISSCLVNKLFAIEAIFQTAARHWGPPRSSKGALARLNGRTLSWPACFFQPGGGLKQGLYLYNSLPVKALHTFLCRKLCFSTLRLFNICRWFCLLCSRSY